MKLEDMQRQELKKRFKKRNLLTTKKQSDIMEEVFQHYSHYAVWVLNNWEEKSKELDNLILQSGLLIEKEVNCNGETHRVLTKSEFNELESKGFVFIPKL